MLHRLPRRLHLCLSIVAAAAIGVIAGCSGSTPAPPHSLSAVTMTALLPATSTLQSSTPQSNQSEQFSTAVSGASNTSVVWTIFDASGASHSTGDLNVGTVSAAGLYTAPIVSSRINVTLYASAAADTSVSRTATITINPAPPPVSVTITPQNPNVATSGTLAFTALVANAPNNDSTVKWHLSQGSLLDDPTLGTIDSTGLYTAPASVPASPTLTVTAVANTDGTTSASTTVTVVSAGAIAVSLDKASATVVTGGSVDFAASVIGSPDTAVTWSAACPASDCGTFTLTGVDTATYITPSGVSANLQVIVSAKAVADPTRSATATVTVTPVINPSLVITFDDSLTPVLANQSLTLTAQVLNLPSGSAMPQINWAQSPATFCMSSDDAADPTDEVDNCISNNADGDGPGVVTPLPSASQTQAKYTAPGSVRTATPVIPNGCALASPSQPYVYVTASTTVVTPANTQIPLQTFACIKVSP